MSVKKRGAVGATTVATFPRKCRKCGRPKPQAEFSRCPTIYGGDGYTKDCKACAKVKRDARKAEKAGQSADPEIEHTGPKVQAGPSIGYAAQLRENDVVLWQTTSDQGEQTIWLSRSEARELAAFIVNLDVTLVGTVLEPA